MPDEEEKKNGVKKRLRCPKGHVFYVDLAKLTAEPGSYVTVECPVDHQKLRLKGYRGEVVTVTLEG